MNSRHINVSANVKLNDMPRRINVKSSLTSHNAYREKNIENIMDRKEYVSISSHVFIILYSDVNDVNMPSDILFSNVNTDDSMTLMTLMMKNGEI